MHYTRHVHLFVSFEFSGYLLSWIKDRQVENVQAKIGPYEGMPHNDQKV